MIDEHENGALAWSGRLALLVSGAGAAVLAVAVLTMRLFPATEPVAGAAAVVGVVAVAVAVIGRYSSVVEFRYAGVPLAQPGPPSGARRRGVLRRRSGIAYGLAAVGSAWVLPFVAYGGADDLLVLSLAVAALGVAVLTGPAARFVVTRRHLHIDTAFHRISVPRRLIGTFERSGLEIRLRLTDRDFYDLRVDSPLWDLGGGHRWRLNSRCQVRTAARLATLLREVPPAAAAGDDAVEIRYRTGMFVFAAVAVLATAAPIVLALNR
ncbi:MAG: hypothetical protein ABW022_23670 [Actinoplanes sp.]